MGGAQRVMDRLMFWVGLTWHTTVISLAFCEGFGWVHVPHGILVAAFLSTCLPMVYWLVK